MAIEDSSRRDLNHLRIDIFKDSTRFQMPARDMSKRKALRDNYKAHAASLIQQITSALDNIPLAEKANRLAVKGMAVDFHLELTPLAA